MKSIKTSVFVLLSLLLLGIYSCAKPKSEEQIKKEEKEMKQVEQNLKTDQERMDSMKKALKIKD